MTCQRPTTVASEGGQSAVDRGRSRSIVALGQYSPVTEIFMAQPDWIEGAPPLVLPPRHKMGQILADALEGCRCASFRVQGFKILLGGRMHPNAPYVSFEMP